MTATLHVLVVEDDPDFTVLIEMSLADSGHRIESAASMHDALRRLARGDDPLDVVLLDLGLPDIEGLDGIRAAIDHASIPVIVYTADGRAEVRQQAADIGASAFLVKGSTTPEELALTIEQTVARSRQPDAAPIVGEAPFHGPEDAIHEGLALLCETTPLSSWACVRIVGSQPVVIVRVGDGPLLPIGSRPAWTRGAQAAIDAGRTTMLEQGVAVAVVDETTFAPAHAMVAPIQVDDSRHSILVGWGDRGACTDAAEVRAVRFVGRQIATVHRLELERARETRRADIADNAASADVLTGLANRREFQHVLRNEEARCRRYGHAASVFIVDLDQLKYVNDTEGHDAGDRYIRSAATAMTMAVRESDTVFRIGGDEFAVLAIECDVHDAETLQARMRTFFEEQSVEASIGWSGRPPEPTLEAAAAAADQAMYAAKLARREDRRAKTDAAGQ